MFRYLIQVVEPTIINWLLRSPTFHRGVGVVEKRVRWYKEGKLPEETGGTNLEETGKGTGELWKHFREEVATQLGRGPPKP